MLFYGGPERTVVTDGDSNISRAVKLSPRVHALGISAWDIYILFTRRAICPRNSSADGREKVRGKVSVVTYAAEVTPRTEDQGEQLAAQSTDGMQTGRQQEG